MLENVTEAILKPVAVTIGTRMSEYIGCGFNIEIDRDSVLIVMEDQQALADAEYIGGPFLYHMLDSMTNGPD